MSAAWIIAAVAYALGAIAFYLSLRPDNPLPRWQAVPLALVWPPALYVAMLIIGFQAARWGRL